MGPVLNCVEFDWDGGDCDPPADAFLPNGDYVGTLESEIIAEYWGGFEMRYSCDGDLTGSIDTDDSPQFEATGACVSEFDDETYTITIEGNFDDEVPSGTLIFTGPEESASADWSGSWAYGNLEADFDGEISDGFPDVRFEGEFEMDRTSD